MASSDQLGFTFQVLGRRIWTVRDLVAAVRTHLEREYTDTWVEGEISNFRAHDSGHLYFTLKDAKLANSHGDVSLASAAAALSTRKRNAGCGSRAGHDL